MKKLVIFSLLAGSLLASCAAQAKVEVKPGEALFAQVKEDTELHEELFGSPKRVENEEGGVISAFTNFLGFFGSK